MRIEVDGLRLDYGEVTALHELTFTLGGGKIYGLLGRNGSGKTSLLSVLAAFRRHTRGEVRVNGQPVWENGAVTRDICLIREGGEGIDIDTVADAVYFTELLRPNWDGEYAAALMDTFELRPKMKVAALSRGKRSALGVVLGLAGRTPLTMFDETYLGMDVPSRYAFYDALLADYMAHPRTFVLSTHLIEEVSSLFEEVLILDGGRLVLQEETERLLARGISVTGPAERVDAFTEGLTVLGVKQLGPTKSAMVYGTLDDARRNGAGAAGLELGPIAMQDLFVHLTGAPETPEAPDTTGAPS